MKKLTQLDRLYQEITSVVLSRQHPVTGLLPASTSVNAHGNYTDAWVRDNVYSILCAWVLASAYKQAGVQDRCDHLEQSTIKLMRGLLTSMMRQADKVEQFKNTLDKRHSLHAKYDTATGLAVVADDAWGHLQIDATSIFLLMLAQMTASGLRIVCTYDEVDFIQNLVYYIASTYRIPDFGIWERGNKINNGKTEINASSVGMAKSALQALDGFNLFGKDATPRAIIHTVVDAISLARSTLSGLLPRESLSKETDSALLSIIGFPAFAVGDKTLVTKTRDNILAKLGGNYGCKRFLWDGHQTVLEESSRLYYEHSELANFEGVESEWPLFFTYLYIHALFDGNESTAQHYRQKIEDLMVDVNGARLIPELFYVALDNIEAEKRQPGSQPRLANENVPLVWAQSLYYVGLMLDEGWVSRDDLDPLRLRRRSRQFSKNQIALVVLAENAKVKAELAKYGVIAETLQEIQPIEVLTVPELVDIYTHIGANKAMNLTGRPARRLQSLATSQSYEINGRTCLSLSWLQSEHSDYRVYDAEFMAKNVERELNHIRTHWLNNEIAVFTWMVDEYFCGVANADVLFNTLKQIQLRTHSEFVGYASAKLAIRASRVNQLNISSAHLTSVKQWINHRASHSLMDTTKLEERVASLLDTMNTEPELSCYYTLNIFLQQHSLSEHFESEGKHLSVVDIIRHIYYFAKLKCYWLLARYCYALLNQYPIDLTDGLAMLVARNMSLVLGKGKANAIVVDTPLAYADLVSALNKLYQHPLERALAQEFLAVLGNVMRVDPHLFDGLRSVSLHDLMMLCAQMSEEVTELDVLMYLGKLAPAQILIQVNDILVKQHNEYARELRVGFKGPESSRHHQEWNVTDRDWFKWRITRGAITRLDDALLKDVWKSLECAQFLVFGDVGGHDHVLNCERVRSSMTAGEVSFANHLDQLTQQLHPTYYKSAVFEALYAFTQFCRKYPDARFKEPLIFTQLLESAAKSYIDNVGGAEADKRDLDILLEQSPSVLQHYVVEVLVGLVGRAPKVLDIK